MIFTSQRAVEGFANMIAQHGRTSPTSPPSTSSPAYLKLKRSTNNPFSQSPNPLKRHPPLHSRPSHSPHPHNPPRHPPPHLHNPRRRLRIRRETSTPHAPSLQHPPPRLPQPSPFIPRW
jgi:hypothetical protein